MAKVAVATSRISPDHSRIGKMKMGTDLVRLRVLSAEIPVSPLFNSDATRTREKVLAWDSNSCRYGWAGQLGDFVWPIERFTVASSR
jgi:hypothetical protein